MALLQSLTQERTAASSPSSSIPRSHSALAQYAGEPSTTDANSAATRALYLVRVAKGV